MKISVVDDYIYINDEELQLYIETVCCSNTYTTIYASRTNEYGVHGYILISRETGYVYIDIPYGDIRYTFIKKIDEVTIDIPDYPMEDDTSLRNDIEKAAIDKCISYANDYLHIDEDKIPYTDKGLYDIDYSYIKQYMNTSERAMGYANLLYLYNKYGSSAIEYLWIYQ